MVTFANGYSFRRAIVLSHAKVPSDLTDFPVMIGGTLAYLKTVANGGKVQSSTGLDIIITSDAAGLTVLDFERHVYSPTTGALELYVRIAALSSTVDTTIYMFYGKTGVSDAANTTGVWNSGFKAVYHLGDGATLDLNDSTSNANNLTNTNSWAAAPSLLSSGNGGGIASTSANAGPVTATNTAMEFTGAITLECITNVTTLPPSPAGAGNRGLIGRLAFPKGYFLMIAGNSGSNARRTEMIINGSECWFNPSSISASTTYYVAGRYTPSTAMVIRRDTTDDAGADAGGIPASITVIGNMGFNIGGVDGSIDEVRVSNVNRGADWLTATYNNLRDNSNFLTIGSEVLPPFQGNFQIRQAVNRASGY